MGGVSFPYLTVIDLRSFKKRRTFGPPLQQSAAASCGARPFQTLVSLCFSNDSKHVLCLSSGPDQCVLEWQWQKEQLTASGQVRASEAVAAVSSLQCVARSASYCPSDNSVVCVTGDGIVQLMSVDWDTGGISDLTPPSPHRSQAESAVDSEVDSSAGVELAMLDVSCHGWLSESRVLLATRTGQLLIAHNGRVTGHTTTQSVAMRADTPGGTTERGVTSTTAGNSAAAASEQQTSGQSHRGQHSHSLLSALQSPSSW